MKLKSKLRAMFTNELLDLIASICDTRRIDSLPQKMKILRDLLYTNGVKFDVLGGATNRIAMFIDGYAVKFAMDSQGYRDNLIEYSICTELQPYVTKSYETNGYILIAECVRLMTESEFVARKQDILNILMTLSEDYLLGDVGFLQKNRTNWGVRDNGELVILDYAYCHRATENLFTCPVCGEGVLTYTSDFDKLICTNKSVCHAVFTYNQRKQEQGDQVDFDMIDERKADSIVLKETEDSIEVGEQQQGKFMFKNGKKVIIVDDDISYIKMMEANKMISTQYDRAEAMEALIQLSMTQDVDKVARETVIQNLDNIKVSGDEEYVVTEDYQSKINKTVSEDIISQDDDTLDDEEEVCGLGYLIGLSTSSNRQKVVNSDKISTTQPLVKHPVDTCSDDDTLDDEEELCGLDYLIGLTMKNECRNPTNIEHDSNNVEEDRYEECLHEPESEDSCYMTDENINCSDSTDAVEDEITFTGKLRLSSVYGEQGNPDSEDVRVDVILDGEHL